MKPGWRRILTEGIAVFSLAIPALPGSNHGAGLAYGQPASTNWQDYIEGPTSRLNEPVAISFAEDNDGSITNPSAVLVDDGVSATLTRTGSASPRLAIDFGLPVSG